MNISSGSWRVKEAAILGPCVYEFNFLSQETQYKEFLYK